MTVSPSSLKCCDQCGRHFEPKFNFQVQRLSGDALKYFCTQSCRIAHASRAAAPESQAPSASESMVAMSSGPDAAPSAAATNATCATCGKHFSLRYAFQQIAVGSKISHVCSMECRAPVIRSIEQHVRKAQRGPLRLAILNQKGGTGKTTTAVNLAAGLAEAGKKTLILDLDAQGHVGISLGVQSPRSLYNLLIENVPFEDCVVPIRKNLDVITANETLAAAELYLARLNDGRERVLERKMQAIQDYDYVIMDCGPSLSQLNLNALKYADKVIVPVSCDFLSLVGVRQILKTLKHINQTLMHPIEIMGVLPTFYDRRSKINNDAVNNLKSNFKDKVLPPIRTNTTLREAPSHRQSIFEYDAESHGAQDYRKLVQWVIEQNEHHHRSVA